MSAHQLRTLGMAARGTAPPITACSQQKHAESSLASMSAEAISARAALQWPPSAPAPAIQQRHTVGPDSRFHPRFQQLRGAWCLVQATHTDTRGTRDTALARGMRRSLAGLAGPGCWLRLRLRHSCALGWVLIASAAPAERLCSVCDPRPGRAATCNLQICGNRNRVATLISL